MVTNTISRGWTDTEDDILREYYPIGGGKLCVKKGVNKKLSTIRMRAKKLGIKSKNTVWSKDEIDVLYAMHKDNTVNAISTKLKGRSPSAVKKKLDELGLQSLVKWSAEDLKILNDYYPIGGSKLVREKGVDKPANLIASKANVMGLKLNKSRAKWSDSDVAILMKYYSVEGMGVLKRLKGKSKSSIINKLNTINTHYREKYKHWGIEDIRFLKQNKDKSVEELVVALKHRSREEIEDLVGYYRWKYVKHNTYSRWTEDEILFLINNYDKYSISELQSKGLNKSKSNIYSKLGYLGLSKSGINRGWTEEEVSILESNYYKKTIDELCDLIPNKSIRAIKHKAFSLGLSKKHNFNWTDDERSILVKYYEKHGVKRVLLELEKQLNISNRTEIEVFKEAINLGLKYK